MYKAKLQELCQKKKWGLPKYSCMKCGPNHDPRFGASVSVNGNSFDSLGPCKSSKEAHNHVAMLAFLHFTTPNSSLTTSSDPSIPIIKPDKVKETPEDLKIQSDAATISHDIHCQYKIQLQKYARLRNLESPSYYSECEGPHASRFKAKVAVGERIFESMKFFDTAKEAENAAAQAALMSFLVDNFQKDESGPYKNLLQELAQGEGFCMPLYKTTNFGAPHRPVFRSTVELEGEIFHGKEAKSKKLAELDAARVAYLALMERASSRIAALNTSLEQVSQLAPYLAQTYTKDVKENNVLEEGLSPNASPSAEESGSFPAMSTKMDKMNTTKKRYSCSESAVSSTMESLASPSILNPDERKNTTGVTPSYLLCSKVRVYQEFPDHAFPKGITVLPIADHKWVAVSLEFPNEESN